MSGGFGLPVLNLQSALGSLGDVYDANFDKERRRTSLEKLGERLKVGDYAGAASTAFDGGDPQTGIGLLKLGQAQRQQQLGIEATRDLATSFGLGGPQGSGPQGYGPRADASPASRAVPSFADDSGPAGSYVANLFKRESSHLRLPHGSAGSTWLPDPGSGFVSRVARRLSAALLRVPTP